jgi:membrane peptidoglycan carboxypeptidase
MGGIRSANVDQCVHLNQCRPPRTDRGGVVQARSVVLTLRAVGRNRRQAVAPAGTANRTRGRLRRLARIALWVISGFIIGSVLLVALYRYLPPPGTPLMLLRRVEGYGIHKSWSSFDHLSANLVRAVIASEDTRFCSHHGFDWNAIETAWDRYRSRRGRLLGASTVSMQTAKNVFLWPVAIGCAKASKPILRC